MTLRQRRLPVLVMAFEAEFFGFFLILYLIEVFVQIVVGQWSGCFLGSIEEEDQDSSTDNHKDDIA